MTFVVVDRFAPVVVVRRLGSVDADAMTRMLRELERCMHATDEKLAFVYESNASVGGSPGPAARQVAGEWLRSESALLTQRCVGIDFVFASPLSRALLASVFWIAQPPVPVRVHTESREAISSAIARVGRQGVLDLDEILRVLAGNSRAATVSRA